MPVHGRGTRRFHRVEEISGVSMLFTPAHDEHPLAPSAGLIVVRGAKPGDFVMIDPYQVRYLRLNRFSTMTVRWRSRSVRI
jgi:hypothetical protein